MKRKDRNAQKLSMNTCSIIHVALPNPSRVFFCVSYLQEPPHSRSQPLHLSPICHPSSDSRKSPQDSAPGITNNTSFNYKESTTTGTDLPKTSVENRLAQLAVCIKNLPFDTIKQLRKYSINHTSENRSSITHSNEITYLPKIAESMLDSPTYLPYSRPTTQYS